MKKNAKLFTTGLVMTSLVAPNIAFANNEIIQTTNENSNININLEKRSIFLGDTSKISISFKENPNTDNIAVNFLCYDKTISTTLNYNQESNNYEGTIEFNTEAEYLNVWKLDSIVINTPEEEQTLSREDLQLQGVNVADYSVTQEYMLTDLASVASYKAKSSAPIKKLAGNTRYDTAIQISNEGWPNGADKVIIVNGESIADGITATPLATTYNAPILIINKDNINSNIKTELNRLNPSEVIIIGGESVITKDVENSIKSITNANITRIGGKTRNETSLLIAKEIDKDHDITKVYLANGFDGEADALSIAAKAGQDKEPIILTNKTEIPTDTYNWLKTQKLQTGYFIGGETVIATNVIHQMADITPNNEATPENSIYKNRIYGLNRHETNAAVIKRFYTEEELNSVLVARSDVLVDALTAGPLAAQLSSPILITPSTSVHSAHSDNLKQKTANIVYQIGGTITDSVINDIAYKLSEHNAGGFTVVLDPGHGGSDSGAVNPLDKTIKEKDYALDVALAAGEYLRNNNVNIVYSRNVDKTLDSKTRINIVNSVESDLVASIHFNASNTQGKGLEVFYRYQDRNGGTSKTLARNIVDNILQEFNLAPRGSDKGIKYKTLDNSTQDYLFMIREINSPSVLVECAFIDNEQDLKLVDTLQERQLFGRQIGKGIEATLK